MTPDPRRAAHRADLADERLRGVVEAARYVAGENAAVVAPLCPFHAAPSGAAEVTATKLLGEPLLVFERRADGWLWTQSRRDDYVGYVRAELAGPEAAGADLVVTALRAHLYPKPDLKAPPSGWAPLQARLAAAPERENGFQKLTSGEWVFARHVADRMAQPDWARDWVAVAEAFEHVPYLWGGESADGVDCSGLIQLALESWGDASPRDSDMQAAELGAELAADAALRRGDMIFWRGHVGVMRDAETLLHATAWAMSTISEPLERACRRIAESGGGPVTARRRLSPDS